MKTLSTMRKNFGAERCVSSFTVFTVLLAALPARAVVVEDLGFVTSPGRVVNGQPLGATAHLQGGGAGDTRNNNGANTDWFVQYSGTTLDEEISSATAHAGSQSWHVANWWADGIVNHTASPWLSAPAGETGTKDNGGTSGPSGAAGSVIANTSRFHSSFWFRTAGTSEPDEVSFVSLSPDDGTGSRWGGRFDLRDAPNTGNPTTTRNGFRARWLSLNQRDAGGGDFATSPLLTRGDWYRADIAIDFVDGNSATNVSFLGLPNDQVTVQLFNSSNLLVWSADSSTPYLGEDDTTLFPGITTWEDAGFYGTSYAVNSMQMRINRDYLDVGNPPGAWAPLANRPAGFYFDQFLVETLNGSTPLAQYFTSFEFEQAQVFIPEPSTFALFSLGAIGLAIHTRRRTAV